MTADPRLLRLLGAWLDTDTPETECAELLAQLETDPVLRRDFAAQVAMIGALTTASDPAPRWLELFGDLAETGSDPSLGEGFEGETMSLIQRTVAGTRRGKIIRFIALGVAAAVAAVVSLKVSRQPGQQPPSIVQAVPEIPQAVAIITGSEGRAPGDDGMAEGVFLPSGTIEQEQGWLGIQTLTSVSITLTAPFRATLVSPERVYVERGQAKVHVPEGAEGFVMESPAFEVLDLGDSAIIKSTSRLE